MTTTNEQKRIIFNDLQQYAYILHRDKYNTFEMEDIESEIMNWGAFKLDKLWDMKQEHELKYRKFLKVSITHLINRMIVPIQVRHRMTIHSSNERISATPILTPSDVEYKLKQHDPQIWVKVKKTVTEKRYNILVEHYFNDKSPTEIAKELNVTPSAIINHIKNAINLLVIKDY